MTLQFTAPPGWPPVPQGWTPPPGWQPDPAWPAPPPGWQFWQPAGAGTYSTVEIGHPGDAFIYDACTPVVSVDGRVVARGWGTHPLPMSAADAQLTVHVPYLGIRAGKAAATLPAGQPVRLRYQAPSVVFLRGTIGGPGETVRSRGRRGVYVATGVILGLILVLIVAGLVFGDG